MLSAPPLLALVPAVVLGPPADAPPPPSLLPSDSAPQAASASEAPNANVAARPSRARGSSAGGMTSRDSALLHHSHWLLRCCSCRRQTGQGMSWLKLVPPRYGLPSPPGGPP